MSKKFSQRLTLDLGERSWNRLTRLQEAMETGTKVGVIQAALQLLDFIVDRVEQGHTFLDRDPSGNVEALTILGVAPLSRTTKEEEAA